MESLILRTSEIRLRDSIGQDVVAKRGPFKQVLAVHDSHRQDSNHYANEEHQRYYESYGYDEDDDYYREQYNYDEQEDEDYYNQHEDDDQHEGDYYDPYPDENYDYPDDVHGYVETLTLRPSEIRYSQGSIGCRFSDGNPLTCVFAHLISGSLKVKDLPEIEVMRMNGHWWTLTGNRRLFMYRMLEEVDVIERIRVTKSWISPTSKLFKRKFTNVCNGMQISCRQKYLQLSLNAIVSDWQSGQDVIRKWDPYKQVLAVHDSRPKREDFNDYANEERQREDDQSYYGSYGYDEVDDYYRKQYNYHEDEDDYYPDEDDDQYEGDYYDPYPDEYYD